MSGCDGGAEPRDTVFAERPIEQRLDDLGGDALATMVGLHAIADLDLSAVIGRRMEPDRADDPPAGPVIEHDRPAEPGLHRRVGAQVGDPVLEEVLEVVGHVGRHRGADLGRGCREVAANAAPA